VRAYCPHTSSERRPRYQPTPPPLWFTSVHRHAGVRLVRKAAALDDCCGGVDQGLPAVPGKLAQLLAGLLGSDSEEFHDGALGLPDSGGLPAHPILGFFCARVAAAHTTNRAPRVRRETRGRPSCPVGLPGSRAKTNGQTARIAGANGAYEVGIERVAGPAGHAQRGS
jgi:hypothetical protein